MNQIPPMPDINALTNNIMSQAMTMSILITVGTVATIVVCLVLVKVLGLNKQTLDIRYKKDDWEGR
jgi:glycyl-tRNA synthetase alpha subunit